MIVYEEYQLTEFVDAKRRPIGYRCCIARKDGVYFVNVQQTRVDASMRHTVFGASQPSRRVATKEQATALLWATVARRKATLKNKS